MANKDIEIEIKLPLYNKEELEKFLNKNVEIKAEKLRQKDTYYTPAHKDFLDANHPYQYLRIRESEKGDFFTYKHCHPENSNKVEYFDEYETRIDDSKSLFKILKVLEYKEIIVVDKFRSIWQFGDVEIAIDEVKDYGVFIELELTSYSDNPKEAKKYLHSILEKLNANVGEEDQDGYVFGILKKQGHDFGK
ncbi:MAG: class IV adenylate cyclase [Candidatus Moranbacteria bacterium]|nr:class IV adenylate cyclase [Candidatus Moranbacteria bacterium]